MSLRRILSITVFGVLFIAAAIGVMLLTSYLRRDNEPIPLPGAPASVGTTEDPVLEQNPQGRVEVTPETIQAVVSTLSRPEIYRRDIEIETYWEDGFALYNISINVAAGITSLRIHPPLGTEKRIIITEDTLYVWYRGDRTAYAGSVDSLDGGYRIADEWQMIVTYEDLLELDMNDIVDAGYLDFDGVDYIYAQHLSPLLGYTRKYYVSIDIGLVTSAEEYDETNALVYLMKSGECVVGEVDPSAFILPDGTVLWN